MSHQHVLGDLADPHKYQGPLKIEGYEHESLRKQLALMQAIRLVETKLADKKRDGLIRGPIHLGIGQEAIAVGVSEHLKSTDRVFSAHRSHAHLLALGSSIKGLFAEVLGKETGLSKGMGGSMHLWDQPRGFYGSVPIVSGTVPLAVGAGLAAKLAGKKHIGVAYLGDGAVEEGVVHESLNLAAIQSIPVLFVVENNLFSSHMHISLRQPLDSTARFAAANNINYEVVDGNDLIAVTEAAGRLVESIRLGKGPGFLELVTYRWRGHVDWREDIDVGVHRSPEELALWKKRDPVARLLSALIAQGACTAEQHAATGERCALEIDRFWDEAMADPYPAQEALLDRVYAKS